MELRLYNTLTRTKEVFQPITPGKVGIYTCGPTVYAPAHIGNLRSYVFPDVLKKLLRRLGYEVQHVVNITDVGHLTSDADTGEDKLERAARQSERSAWDIAKEYTELFLKDLERLSIEIAPQLPRATAHIPEQIAIIEKLEAGGYTYVTGDGVYFDTSRFANYGRMARLKAEGLQEGSRVEMGEKRNKTDFALWKFSPPDSQRQMEWDSPWGKGFPGWHVECSAMSMKYLGQHFDIHTGGSDHIPVHHTNEIAQSEAVTGHQFVNIWLHGEYLVLAEDKRMGKSEGNPVTLQRLIDDGFEPLAFRYLTLNSHYRSYLNYSTQALKSADTALMGLRGLLRGIQQEAGDERTGKSAADTRPDKGPERLEEQSLEARSSGKQSPEKPDLENQSLEQAMLGLVCDDLNTPRALAALWTTLRDDSVPNPEKLSLAGIAEELLSLGLFDFSRLDAREDAPAEIKELAERRWAARQARDFAESDRLRDELAAQGFTMRDGKDSYELIKSE